MCGWSEVAVGEQMHGQPLHHPLPGDSGRSPSTERNGSASRNSFDLISRLFRSFFFLDSYGLGNNLKINLFLFLQVHPGPLLGLVDCPWERMDCSHGPVGADRSFSGQRGKDALPPLAWSSWWELRGRLRIA